MKAVFRFLGGLFIGLVYVLGSAAMGYILFEEFNRIYPLAIAAIILLLVLDITAITSFPRSVTFGLFVPQAVVAIGLGFLFAKEEATLYFTDDFAYRSCVGNSDNKKGAQDCSHLLQKIETKGYIILKEIENTKGDYWLAEVLSYRGRHYMRDKKIELGKADFARALLLSDGVAVTVNNLAEAGFTRSDMFEDDYNQMLGEMATDAQCLASASKLGREKDAANFSASVSRRTIEAVKLCRLSTGREEGDCESIVERRMSSILSLANRLYAKSSREELGKDYSLCKAQ